MREKHVLPRLLLLDLAVRRGREAADVASLASTYVRACINSLLFLPLYFYPFATPLLPFYVPTFRPFCPPVERTYFDLYRGVGVFKERRFGRRWNLYT